MKFLTLILLILFSTLCCAEQASHPRLVLNQSDIQAMVANRDSLPDFNRAYLKLKRSIDNQMAQQISVPVPKDAGGGFTHEQHKRNYKTIKGAGILYQLTGKKVYADYALKLLKEYAKLYPTLGEHPKKKEQAPGRLFWQSLNEAVWLVESIQGYDAILSAISAEDRTFIEANLLRPMATFLSDESPQTFNKIHNHGTWAAAAVGMTGYTLGDQEMVEKALYGLDKSGRAGFLKQLERLFSPDGYYTEGPYYQRYALMPFVLFAKAIDYNEPQRKIFEFRNDILLKAIYTTIQLSYNNLFFPINDALKDKGLDTIELVHGVAIAYGLTNDPALLSIAKVQHTISLSGDGVKIAQGLHQNLAKPFPYQSLQLRDGAQGDQGALSILRSGSQAGHQALIMKNTSQGMGHGHFDKLNWLFYDNGNEIVSDYGAARFLNVESKYGGHYLPENKAWAKQTIAHNTLTVDEKSHFNGKLSKAKNYHPELLAFDTNETIQIVSAKISDAYPEVKFVRTLALINDPQLEYPFVLDVLKAEGKGSHQFDLPLHYHGHIVNHNFAIDANTRELKPLGKRNGYQFLWRRAQARPESKNPESQMSQVTWLLDNRFYTYSMASKNQQIIFAELGANDPNFNLRHEPVIIQRVKDTSKYTFVATLETHGEYNPALEYTNNSYSQIANINHFTDGELDYLEIETVHGKRWGLALSYDNNEQNTHRIKVRGKTRKWQGFYKLFKR